MIDFNMEVILNACGYHTFKVNQLRYAHCPGENIYCMWSLARTAGGKKCTAAYVHENQTVNHVSELLIQALFEVGNVRFVVGRTVSMGII